MLDVYWGEIFTSPTPLELSLNYCSHKCAYCFANLNEPDRQANVKRILSLLRDYHQRETVAAMLLQRGYPVAVSNRVDPFAHSNYKIALPILETMTALGIGVMLQTRGGKGINDVLSFLPPSVWYISLALTDEALRAKLEPGAPSLEERHRLIAQLVARGHTVVVGVNPLVPEWLPDPEPLLTRIQADGAWGVWIERLHLNPKQARNLSEKERALIGESLIRRAFKRTPADDFPFFLDVRRMARDMGLQVFSAAQCEPSDFFAPWQVYERTFPTLQGFVNWCHSKLPDGGLVTFDDYLAYFGPQFPAGEWGIDSYLGSVAHNIWHTHQVPTRMTYSQLLALIWQDGRIKLNPVHSPAFACVSVDGQAMVDDNGMPVLLFVPEGTGEWWIDLETEAEAA